MDLHDRRALKTAARNSLAAAPYDPVRLILIHTGISIGLSLLCTIIDYVLNLQIQNTGGLGGLGTRSILSTARSVLQVIVSLGLPFWEAGYCFATIKIVRGKEANPASLLEGFRRFGPLLRGMMLQSIIYIAVLILCFTVGSRIFLLTPLSDPFYEIMQTIPIESTLYGPELLMDEATATAIAKTYIPMLVIVAVLFLIVYVVLSYRFRFVNYLLLDYPGMHAREALRLSGYYLRGNKLALFKLDLSFLWFYVLSVAVALLAYGDYVLAYLGIPLPVSGGVAFFAFLVVSLVGLGLLFIRFRNQVEVTYARFYDLAVPAEEMGSFTNS